MIPQIIHQTWKNECVPTRFAACHASWRRHNPNWRHILWTDRMLLNLIEEHYPSLLELYCSYPKPVQRADVGRYALLHKFGGVYADIDSECVAPLSRLEDETRIVLCHEPPSHWPNARYRSHPFILFNGVMASPPEHRFWQQLLNRLPETRHAPSVEDSTGPFLLTGIYQAFDNKDAIAVEPCHLFTPTDRTGQEATPYGASMPKTLSRHRWAGTWWLDRRQRKQRKSIARYFHWIRQRLTPVSVLEPADARAQVDPGVLKLALPQENRLAILIPVRDAVSDIEPFLKAIDRLDVPAAAIKLVFCEGDSVDGTWEKLKEIEAKKKRNYRDIVILRRPVLTRFERHNRADRDIQRARRGGLAKVRNYMIDHGLNADDDWALWIDVDVWKFPTDIWQKLREAAAPIVVPNCVVSPGGPSFDTNSFVSCWEVDQRLYRRFLCDGLFQPPADFAGRLSLSSLRHSERVNLDAVGGTMLLVDARLHRGGLRFPDRPYNGLIETEAFGALARDLGIPPVGLPRLEVLHVPY